MNLWMGSITSSKFIHGEMCNFLYLWFSENDLIYLTNRCVLCCCSGGVPARLWMSLHRRHVWERDPGFVSGTRGQCGHCDQPAQQVCVHRQWFFYCCCFMLPTYLSHNKSSVHVVFHNLKISTTVPLTFITSNFFMVVINSNVFLQQLLPESKHEETNIISPLEGTKTFLCHLKWS